MNLPENTRRLLGIISLSLVTMVIVGCQAIALAPSTAVITEVEPATDVSSTLPFQETRETAQAALMQTHFALIETVTPVSPTPGEPSTRTPIPFTTGIYEIGYMPSAAGLSVGINSQWRGIVNGERTYVYAGAYRDVVSGSESVSVDTSRGLVGVEVFSADLSDTHSAFYEPPAPTGILTITAESKGRLTLASASGLTLYFDVPTRLFVEALSSSVTAPTVTPLPPAMPDALVPSVTPFTGYPAPPTQSTPSPATAVAP